MSTANFSSWTSEDVSVWLGSLSLHHLVPNFERMQIDGSRLAKLSDQDLRSVLRLTKPAEVMAIRGAINKLVEDASKPVHYETGPRLGSTPRLSAPTSPRERSGSIDKKMSRTVPRDIHRNTMAAPSTIRQPKLVQGTASELVDKECKYSGWIRKQGGGYKNWKRRYLILRLGCLYYFPNETASTAKGSFVLSGYKTEICKEPEIIKKYKYTLKLLPMNPQVRTYYISVGSERELLGWKEAIDDEIQAVSNRRISLARRQNSTDTLPVYSTSNAITTTYDDDDDDDDEDNPYDTPEGFQEEDDAHNYDDPESVIYDKPDVLSEEDDPYSKIEDDFPQGLGRGRPTVPSRSAYSLQSPTNKHIETAAAAALANEAAENPEDTYLPIIAGGPAMNPIAAQPDLSRTSSPPVVSSSAPPTMGQFGHDDHDYDNGPDSEGDDDDEDDDGGYYIMFRKPEELMPQSCLFDRLERSEADRLLKEKYRDGTYLIRGGSHAGAEKVLSVWHIDRCRHYKLFKDDNSSFSLTQGQSFRTIPELLQYYTLQAHLPKSDFYLGDPFNPNDH